MVELPRSHGRTWTPGTWRAWVHGPTQARGAVVICPQCTHGMSLGGESPFGSRHTIAEDGTVSPSLVCPHEGCSWHVFVRLIGWSTGGTDGTDGTE